MVHFARFFVCRQCYKYILAASLVPLAKAKPLPPFSLSFSLVPLISHLSPSLYIAVFPQLYGHMISQRKKVIGGAKSKQE